MEVNRMQTVEWRQWAIYRPIMLLFGLRLLRVLTAGTRSFLTSSTALLILISALACVSSTVSRTWRSSFKCSQFGFPLFCSSWTQRRRTREIVSDCDNLDVLEHEHSRQHIRGSGGKRQVYIEDERALWREGDKSVPLVSYLVLP